MLTALLALGLHLGAPATLDALPDDAALLIRARLDRLEAVYGAACRGAAGCRGAPAALLGEVGLDLPGVDRARPLLFSLGAPWTHAPEGALGFSVDLRGEAIPPLIHQAYIPLAPEEGPRAALALKMLGLQAAASQRQMRARWWIEGQTLRVMVASHGTPASRRAAAALPVAYWGSSAPSRALGYAAGSEGALSALLRPRRLIRALTLMEAAWLKTRARGARVVDVEADQRALLRLEGASSWGAPEVGEIALRLAGEEGGVRLTAVADLQAEGRRLLARWPRARWPRPVAASGGLLVTLDGSLAFLQLLEEIPAKRYPHADLARLRRAISEDNLALAVALRWPLAWAALLAREEAHKPPPIHAFQAAFGPSPDESVMLVTTRAPEALDALAQDVTLLWGAYAARKRADLAPHPGVVYQRRGAEASAVDLSGAPERTEALLRLKIFPLILTLIMSEEVPLEALLRPLLRARWLELSVDTLGDALFIDAWLSPDGAGGPRAPDLAERVYPEPQISAAARCAARLALKIHLDDPLAPGAARCLEGDPAYGWLLERLEAHR